MNKRGQYNKKEKSIRLRSRYVFCTYPKCSIPLKDILDQLNLSLREVSLKIEEYIICHELHEDGDPHRHAWIKLSRAPEYISPAVFYLHENNTTYKGDFQDQRFTAKCAKYVTKDNDYITNLTPNALEVLLKKSEEESSRMDMGMIAKELMAGRPLEDLILLFPALFWRIKEAQDNLRLYKKLIHKPISLKPEELTLTWIWGDTGAGKSKEISEKYPDAYIKNEEVFWCGYDYQKVVHFQDVDSSWGRTLYCFKTWCDLYPFNARVKHDPTENLIRPTVMYVTSQYTIRETYERMFKLMGFAHDEPLIGALERRFTQVHKPKPYILPDVFPCNYFYSDENKENFCMFCKRLDCDCFNL